MPRNKQQNAITLKTFIIMTHWWWTIREWPFWHLC